jgi:hypothetical protein
MFMLIQTLQRTFGLLIVAGIGCLGAACQQVTAPTQPPPPAAELSVLGRLDDGPLDDGLGESECDDDDNDGVTNGMERLLRLSPTDADSDDDGINDGDDDANGNGFPDGDEDDDDDKCAAAPV